MRQIVKAIVNHFGYDIVRIDRSVFPFLPNLQRSGIESVIDVGANVGQYAQQLRKVGFNGDIFSFEPVSESFSILAKKARRDQNWQVFNYALGSVEEHKTINISEANVYSSFMRINDGLPDWTKIVRTQQVSIMRLDSIFNSIVEKRTNVLLKLDVQGYENEVLEGAAGILDKIAAVQMEMAIVTSYANQSEMFSQVEKMSRLGFTLADILAGARDIDNRLLEVDGFFVRA